MPQRSKQPRIKNYRSRGELPTIFETIRRSLATHGAKRVVFEHDEEGQANAISFTMNVQGHRFTYHMPNYLEGVTELVEQAYREMGRPIAGERLAEQSYITSWANLRDWVLAQMALVDSSNRRVPVEQIFFPYLLDEESGKTAYDEFIERLALPEPRRRTTIEEVK